MAKKTLTPEQAEIKAMKKEKKSQNWTKFWAIVLAAVLTFGVVALGKNQAQTAIDEAKENSVNVNSDANANEDSNLNDDENLLGDDSSNSDASNNDSSNNDSSNNDASNNDSSNNNASNNDASNNNSNNNAQQNNGPSKADAIKLLNDVTAKAAKGNYHWERESYYTKALEVSGKSTLDKVIQMVDKNATVDSVVGGFLDITGEGNLMTADVENGQIAVGMKDKDKFLLIPSTLAESDVKQYKVEGNKYMFQLNPCNRPQKDGSNPLSKVTNDFITKGEVNDGIQGALSGAGLGSLVTVNDINVDFKSILVVAEIVDGKLVKYEISYAMDVKSMELKAMGIGVGGSGAGVMKCWYTNFNY